MRQAGGRARQARELGRAEQRGPGAQRGHGGDGAVDERRALARRLRQHERGEHLRVLHDEHTGERRRSGRAPHDAGGHAGRLAQPGPAHEDARVLRGELQRRGRVEDDEGARPLVPVRAEQDLVDALGVVDVLVDRGDPLDGLVAQRETGVRAAPRAHGLGEVERLHAVAVEVDRRQLVAEPGGRLEVVQRAGAHARAPRPCRRRRSPSRRRGRRRRRAEGRARGGGRRARTRRARRRAPPAPRRRSGRRGGRRSALRASGAGRRPRRPRRGRRSARARAARSRGRRRSRPLPEARAPKLIVSPPGVNPSTSASMRAASSAGSGAGSWVSSSLRALRRAFSARSSPPSSCQRTWPWRLMIVGRHCALRTFLAVWRWARKSPPGPTSRTTSTASVSGVTSTPAKSLRFMARNSSVSTISSREPVIP